MNLEAAEKKLQMACERAGHLPKTITSYRGVLRRYVCALQSGECTGLQSYLDDISSGEDKLSPSSIKQVVCALVFYIKNVQRKDPGRLFFPKGNGHRRAPVCLSMAECQALFLRMSGTPLLQASIMLGSGLRVSEMLQLRLKDLDFAAGTIIVRGGKGDKDRTVPMPQSLRDPLQQHVQRCLVQHQDDRARGIICPVPQKSLRRKLGESTFGRAGWFWLFPSAKVHEDKKERWHATEKAVASALHKAADRVGILKRVTPHVMRHSFATALLRTGSDIRTIQDLLGHADIRTTMRYLHAETCGLVTSPIDMEPTLETVVTFPAILPSARLAKISA